MREVSSDRLQKDARRVLEHPFWISDLQTSEVYERIHDDHDGTKEGRLMVQFTLDGDVWITTDKHQGHSMRFRTFGGGGQSQRVRNALMILALAIKLDNEEHPQE